MDETTQRIVTQTRTTFEAKIARLGREAWIEAMGSLIAELEDSMKAERDEHEQEVKHES